MARELEIKCKVPEGLHLFMAKIAERGWIQTGYSEQRNHYFTSALFSSNASLRTRIDDLSEKGALLIVKRPRFSTGDAINGQDRIETENQTDMPIEDLDRMLIESGIAELQSKWARQRFTYDNPNVPVILTCDFNSGYGELVELEAKPGYDITVGGLVDLTEQLLLEPLEKAELNSWYEQVLADNDLYYNSFLSNADEPVYVKRS